MDKEHQICYANDSIVEKINALCQLIIDVHTKLQRWSNIFIGFDWFHLLILGTFELFREILRNFRNILSMCF